MMVQWVRKWAIWGILKVKGAEGYRWFYGYGGVVEIEKLQSSSTAH